MLPKMGAIGTSACVVLLLCAVSSVNSYSKYGRGCQDIGCLPSEECVITSDSCSYTQREGKDCGSYPTCKRKSSSSSSSSMPVNPSGSALNPGYPQGLQPMNPYNPSFVFGQSPYYPGQPAGGNGGPPGGSNGILGGSGGGMALGGGGGGLAPYGSNYGGYQNPNMFNKPPPQYQNQNQNPFNRQTQAHPSSAARPVGGGGYSVTMMAIGVTALTFAMRQHLMMAMST